MAEKTGNNEQRKRLSLTSWIVISLLVGVCCGLFFGEYTRFVKWIGDAFVGLLQMAVLPYVAASLVTNVGGLSPKAGWKLLKYGVFVLMMLWAVGIATLFIMSLSFPEWESGSFYSTRFTEEPQAPNWLDLFIPANPFRSLAENSIPAVVVFCIGIGIALMTLPNKDKFLEPMEVLVEALARLNKLVVKLTPVGLFAIVAHATGTIDLQQLILIQGYLLPYIAAGALLTFVVLPALIATLTPLGFGEVNKASRDPLVAAFVIGNSFVVLPMIIEAIEELLNKNLDRTQLEPDAQLASHADYMVALAYPFPDIGRIVGLVFIPFAAWFYGNTIDPATLPAMMGLGILGAFAKPVITIPWFLNIAELPMDIFGLWLASGVVAARVGDLMKTMHLIAFTILTIALLSGHMRFKPAKILIGLAFSTLLLFAAAMAVRFYLDVNFKERYSREKLISSRQLIFPDALAHVADTVVNELAEQRVAPHPQPLTDDRTRIDRIQKDGKVRVGFDEHQLPFCYRNDQGQLIGLDVQMAIFLANDLGVDLEFVPIHPGRIEEQLANDEFDVAMSGIEGTMARAPRLPAFDPYMYVTMSIVVCDHDKHLFRDRESTLQIPNLKLAYLKRGYFYERLPQIFRDRIGDEVPEQERVTLIPLDRVEDFFNVSDGTGGEEVAGLLISAEAGYAWTLQYPNYTVTNPLKGRVRIPLYYLTDDDEDFEDFLRNWFSIRRSDGTFQQMYDYWILGVDQKEQLSRWSIIKDVLGWVK